MLDALVQLSFSIQDLLGRVAARYDVSVTQVRLFGTLRDREPTMTDLTRPPGTGEVQREWPD